MVTKAGLPGDMIPMAPHPIAAGQTALQAGDWRAAQTAFEAALREQDSPEAQDGLGVALWWLVSTAVVGGLTEPVTMTGWCSGGAGRSGGGSAITHAAAASAETMIGMHVWRYMRG